jgi:predicted transcriptional regulator
MLIRYAGQSQRDVADLLGIGSGSAVCKQLAALPGKLTKDRRLRRQIKQAEARLEETRSAQRIQRG